jgi:hypothetical protein
VTPAPLTSRRAVGTGTGRTRTFAGRSPGTAADRGPTSDSTRRRGTPARGANAVGPAASRLAGSGADGSGARVTGSDTTGPCTGRPDRTGLPAARLTAGTAARTARRGTAAAGLGFHGIVDPGPPQHQDPADVLHRSAEQALGELLEHGLALVTFGDEHTDFQQTMRGQRPLDLFQHRRRDTPLADMDGDRKAVSKATECAALSRSQDDGGHGGQT